MGYNLYSVLGECGIGGLIFWLIGFPMLLVGVKKGRKEFRVKGYLRLPSGLDWFSFLLRKHYDGFADAGTRFFFGIAHFCMIGGIVVLSAAVALIGCVFLLRMVSMAP
jgi:hypothetical protein